MSKQLLKQQGLKALVDSLVPQLFSLVFAVFQRCHDHCRLAQDTLDQQ